MYNAEIRRWEAEKELEPGEKNKDGRSAGVMNEAAHWVVRWAFLHDHERNG